MSSDALIYHTHEARAGRDRACVRARRQYEPNGSGQFTVDVEVNINSMCTYIQPEMLGPLIEMLQDCIHDAYVLQPPSET